MFTSIRRYRLDSGDVDDAMRIVDHNFAPLLEQLEGFVAYQAIDCGRGDVVTVSIFTDMSSCLASEKLAAQFVKSDLADFTLERVDVLEGDVLISRAANRVLEPAGW